MYHVIAAPPAGAPFPGLYVEPQLFAAQMQALKQAGWHAVTQDQVDALSLSDRVAVMHGSRIAQLGIAHEIHERPANPFVADFIGTNNFLSPAWSDLLRAAYY